MGALSEVNNIRAHTLTDSVTLVSTKPTKTMKSSPRPPRRFSRWQTTKRTFVLGGIGPKPTQNTRNQEPRGSSNVSVA
ncbi:hypothetical protein ElyMa_002570400, partial [Elysia marginata]